MKESCIIDMSPAETRKQRYWKPEDDQLSDKDKLVAKIKRDPFIPIGKCVCVAVSYSYAWYFLLIVGFKCQNTTNLQTWQECEN